MMTSPEHNLVYTAIRRIPSNYTLLTVLKYFLYMQQFGFVHLSAGDLLREERNKEGSEYGELIEETIRNGRIVPVEITCSLIEMVLWNYSSVYIKLVNLYDQREREREFPVISINVL
jgi:hypothetical protein